MDELTVLVTGAFGFMGSNLAAILRRQPNVTLIEYGRSSSPDVLDRGLREADVIFHLAGINRPQRVEEYEEGNADFTEQICARLEELGRAPRIVFSSSIQAELDNPYGISKRRAEDALLQFARKTGASVALFRLKNVFGKWCRPNYNSVVATFCHNIARGLPITISDPDKVLELVYIDDVCDAMLAWSTLDSPGSCKSVAAPADGFIMDVSPVFRTTLGGLAGTIRSFKEFRQSLQVPSLQDPFITRLYATYLSYLTEDDFAYPLNLKSDNRGGLAEFLKSPSFGQIFVSHTKPGVTRGDHYHHTKTEKFFVVQGQAIIRFRHIRDENVIEYRVSGEEYRVVDIPPGYTHSIENVGEGDLVTLFWADEVFDPERPDTYYERVMGDG